jgi:hypothetical protein
MIDGRCRDKLWMEVGTRTRLMTPFQGPRMHLFPSRIASPDWDMRIAQEFHLRSGKFHPSGKSGEPPRPLLLHLPQ